MMRRASISLGVAVVFHASLAFALSHRTIPSAAPSAEPGNFEVVELPPPPPTVQPEPTPVQPEAAIQPEFIRAAVAELSMPTRKPRPPVRESLPREVTPEPDKEISVAVAPETASPNADDAEIKTASFTTAAQKDESPVYFPPDNKAAYLQNPNPLYPVQARRKGLQGVVLLTVEVSAEGLPLSLSVKESSGVLLLDDAAVESVRRWKFVAATLGGRPVAAFVEIPIRFMLQNS